MLLKIVHGFVWGCWLNNSKGRSYIEGHDGAWDEFCNNYALQKGDKLILDLQSSVMGDHGVTIPVTLQPDCIPYMHPS